MTLRRASHGETGTVTAFVACLTVALLAMAGLVVDGGNTLAARRRLFNEANAAARAGAQAADEQSLRRGTVRLNAAAARTRALDHLRRSGLTGTVEVTNDTVTVKTTATQPVTVLGIIGIGPLTVHASGTARALRGVTSPDG